MYGASIMLFLFQVAADKTSASVVIERKALSKTIKRQVKNEQAIDSVVAPQKKRRKSTRNEIDDIFGF